MYLFQVDGSKALQFSLEEVMGTRGIGIPMPRQKVAANRTYKLIVDIV